MELKHVKGLGPAKQEKLREAGIKTIHGLAQADVEKVAARTGLPAESVREFKQKATALALIEDIKGIGPASIQVLAESGYRSAKEFYEASSERLAKELKVAQDKVKAWQAEARKQAERIREEARTPEGRKHLVAEGRELAEKTAHQVQVTVKDLAERLQAESHKALQMAKDLQARAPELAKKAEAALKDAEAKAKEAVQKAETAVKAEVEKLKAANQGLVNQVKATFGKKDGKA